MRYEAGVKPKPPRPHHVRALKLADAKVKRERNAARTGRSFTGGRSLGPQGVEVTPDMVRRQKDLKQLPTTVNRILGG
jgi:hypothetical protein